MEMAILASVSPSTPAPTGPGLAPHEWAPGPGKRAGSPPVRALSVGSSQVISSLDNSRH